MPLFPAGRGRRERPSSRRDSGDPPNRFGSDAAATPAAVRDEIREVTRSLQHLQADLMKPLQEALDNEPSEDMVPWVDTLLSEVQTQVEQLQQQAQICMEHDHFDIAERIVNCSSDFEDMRIRASSWKEEASRRAAQEAETAAQEPPAPPRSRAKSGLSPQVGRLASIQSEGTPSESAASVSPALPSPAASLPKKRSQDSTSLTLTAPRVPQSPTAEDAVSSQASQSPSAGPFGSVKSQAGQSPSAGPFGSVKSQVPQSPPAGPDTSKSQASQSPSAGPFGSAKSQALQSPSADPFGSVKSQALPSPGGAFGSLPPQAPQSPAAASSTSEAAKSPAAGPMKSLASQASASPAGGTGQAAADPWQSLRSWMGDPFGTSASQTGMDSWPAAQATSPAVGKQSSFSGKSPLGASPPSLRFDMWPKAAGDTEPAWPDALEASRSQASAPEQSPAGGKSVSSTASARLQREQEAAKRQLTGALGSSQADPHFLATAVHAAKSSGLDQVEPALVQQAERALEKVQREASNAELRSSLSAATSAVSARFGTEDAAGLGKDAATLRSVLAEARSAGLREADLLQAEQALFKASQLQQQQATQASPVQSSLTLPPATKRDASPAASPKPSLQAPSPSKPPASSYASPSAAAEPSGEEKAMKDKVAKLLQTLLAGGSGPESLRKAAEVAAAAGLAPEICAYARSAAESRSVAHEKAVAALASGSLDAIRQAKVDVELAGGPTADLRQLTQVLEMQRAASGPAGSPSASPRSGFPPLDMADMRRREERLLQRLREARGRHLDELRRELSSGPGVNGAGAVAFTAPALQQYQPDLRRVQQPRRHAQAFVDEAAPWREVRTEPAMRQVPPPSKEVQGVPVPPRSSVAPSGALAEDHRWLNPFGVDPVEQAFNPMGLPPSDYNSMLTNAQRLMQTPGRPFESPDFWRADGRMPSVLHV